MSDFFPIFAKIFAATAAQTVIFIETSPRLKRIYGNDCRGVSLNDRCHRRG